MVILIWSIDYGINLEKYLDPFVGKNGYYCLGDGLVWWSREQNYRTIKPTERGWNPCHKTSVIWKNNDIELHVLPSSMNFWAGFFFSESCRTWPRHCTSVIWLICGSKVVKNWSECKTLRWRCGVAIEYQWVASVAFAGKSPVIFFVLVKSHVSQVNIGFDPSNCNKGFPSASGSVWHHQ